jgi:amidase
MTKSAKDLAVLMDVLVDPSKTRLPEGGYVSQLTRSWEGIRIGTLDPEIWKFKDKDIKILDPSMEEQLVRSFPWCILMAF